MFFREILRNKRDEAVIIFRKKKMFKRVLMIIMLVFILDGLNIAIREHELAVSKVAASSKTTVTKSATAAKSTTSKSTTSGKSSTVGKSTSQTKSAVSGKTTTASVKGKTVVIDAGHGGYDVGSMGPKGIEEKNITLAVALKVGKILESNGVKVIYTRKTDKVSWPSIVRADLDARVKISNNSKADLFISIHTNSSVFKSVKGIETYYACNASSKSKTLANLVQNQLVKDMGKTNRGVKPSLFYVLRNNKLPAVLVELGFISNTTESASLNSSSDQNRYASSLAKGIMNYLSSK